MNKFLKLSITLTSAVILSGCMSGKMSPQQESALGAQQEQQMLRKVKLIHSGQYYNAVRNVGSRIASVSGRPDFQWRYHLVNNSKTANAFVLPGGKVFVYSGLFKYASNEAWHPCAISFPFPIFKSTLNMITCLYITFYIAIIF